MKKEDYIVYKYKTRSDVISDNVIKTLNEVYDLTYPKPEKSFLEMCRDIQKEAEKQGKQHDPNFRIMYGKYQWPIDFFYLPQKVLETVWHNRQEAYGIEEYWRSDIKALVKFLFEEGGMKEVYSPTQWSNGEDVRHCEDMPLVKEIIGEEAADKLKDVLESYMNTYRWGLGDVNQFGWGFMSTPTCNKETVVKAWKEAFNKHITIPEDNVWVDEYEMEDIEEEFNSSKTE